MSPDLERSGAGRDWIAVHVFYASNADPMLVECIDPLVRDLRERGLLARFFFIKYWLEGPHIRVRLLPAPDADRDEIRRLAVERISAYLEAKPALYESDMVGADDAYKQMFVTEYGEDAWNAAYGPDGTMPLRPNNSCQLIPYEPEFDRYGGPAGMELSEWHFEHSSETVLRLLDTANVHVRPVLLGLSAQLTLAICYAFLDGEPDIAQFLSEFRAFWELSYVGDNKDHYADFERAFTRSREGLLRRAAQLRRAVVDGRTDGLTPLERDWVDHVRQLRDLVTEATRQGRMIFPQRQDGSPRAPLTDVGAVRRILLSSYVHMTDNRLGVSIPDEVYLSYVLQRTMEEMAAESVTAAPS